jgi:hypothetical protein
LTFGNPFIQHFLLPKAANTLHDCAYQLGIACVSTWYNHSLVTTTALLQPQPCYNHSLVTTTALCESLRQIRKTRTSEAKIFGREVNMARGAQSESNLPGPVTISGAYMPAPASPTITSQTLSAPATASVRPPIDDQMRRDNPWKYDGYKAFSEWMASENDFFLFRRFESLNANTILYLQHRISGLENRLHEIHRTVEESTEEKWKNSSLGWDANHMPERLQIMDELSCLLLHYSKHKMILL